MSSVCSSMGRAVLISVALATALAAAPARAGAASDQTLLGRPLIRDGFHFQAAFGVGGGPDSAGLFHAMEVGGTFRNGWTLALLHTFIQNKGIIGPDSGPDLFGGWLLELKVPVLVPELVAKVAAGPGGTHDQSDGIKANWGFGWAYGLDFDIPLFARSGITLSATGLHAIAEGAHHFGASFAVGYTFF